MPRQRLFASLLIGIAIALPARAADKLRIVVDKVMQPTRDWKTEEWMVRAAAEAGFNVYSPRVGHEDLKAVRQVTEWCRKYGIRHLPWMRGSLAAGGDAGKGKRLVWANGAEQPLWSPTADELWEWMTRYIVAYAKMSREFPELMGVSLDYENYATGGKQGNCYSLSYDLDILQRFARTRKLELPELAPAERKSWLEEQGLHEAVEKFQVDQWRQRCRRLRKEVDRYNPRFQFCVYPAPGTPFIVQAIYPEWATEAAPLILADASTYGRPTSMPEQAALQFNRDKLLRNRKVAEEAGIPFVYTGGIDPVVHGADPEFCGKNAVMISETTDGYWIFYEGPKYEVDHPEYWKWFTWANRAIAAGRFAAQHEPRQTEEAWLASLFRKLGGPVRVQAPAWTGRETTYPLCRVRGEGMLLVGGSAGKEVRVTLADTRVGSYQSPVAWEARDDKMQKLAAGSIDHLGSGDARFTPPQDGVYLLAVSAGNCAWRVLKSNAPLAFYAADGLHLIGTCEALYFAAPDKPFTLQIRGGGGVETVRVQLLAPDGSIRADGETSLEKGSLTLSADPGDQGGKIWSVRTLRASEGTLEDQVLIPGEGFPPIFCLAEDQVFALTPRED